MTVASPPSGVVEQAERLRRRLAVGGPLAGASIGTVPILWNNADLPELRLGTGADVVLDDIARTGYEGTQLGINFPEGDALKGILAARGLRLAEVYAWFEATVEGPVDGSLEQVRERIRLLQAGGGEVLCIAFDGSGGAGPMGRRATDPRTPRLTDDGWQRTIELLTAVAEETRAAGARIAFHPHAGTYVETPEEVDRLASSIAADVLPFCLDVGHYTVGGGDPVTALRTYGDRVTHVHLKDVDPEVLARLRDGSVRGSARASGAGCSRSSARASWTSTGSWRPRRATLRRLADGRAGQRLAAARGERGDRPPGAGGGPSPRVGSPPVS